MSIERDRLAEDLLSFAQVAPKALSEADLLNEMMKRVEQWGVTHIAAGIMCDASRTFKPGPRFGKLNVAWASTYFDQQLYRDDPVMEASLRAEKADYWDKSFDASALSKAQQRVLGLAEDFGAADGHMTPVTVYNGDVVIVSYQGSRLERHPDVDAILRGLALYYGIEGQRLVTRRQMKSGRFAGVTARQMQVLHLSALGQRDADIADELGISVRMVEMHLMRARQSIGAANTKEAIALLHAAPHETAPITSK